MVTTVTSSAIEVVGQSTVVSHANNGLALIPVLTFLFILVVKEMAIAGTARSTRSLTGGLNIALVPLGIASLIIYGARVLQSVH